jgi:hypothetical protein
VSHSSITPICSIHNKGNFVQKPPYWGTPLLQGAFRRIQHGLGLKRGAYTEGASNLYQDTYWKSVTYKTFFLCAAAIYIYPNQFSCPKAI